MTRFQYYSCRELLSLYPNVKRWGWSPTKIGTFLSCHLLQGRTFGKNGRPLITESSFLKLMEYTENSINTFRSESFYLNYEEVMERIPQAECYSWSPTRIGILASAHLIHKKKCSIESRNLVAQPSVIELINFIDKRFVDIAKKPIIE